MKTTSLENPSTSRQSLPGFSLLELLIVLGALSSVLAMGFIHLSNTHQAATATKLTQDVAAMNRAVRTYKLSGGDLTTATTPDAVMAKLKTISSRASATAGLRGAMIDLRLRGVASTGTGTPRAVWDTAAESFKIATSGSGYQEFVIDPAAAPAIPTEESRKVLLALDDSDKWIWGFNEARPTPTGPRTSGTTIDEPVITPGPIDNIIVLQAPAFSIPGALYDYSAFAPDLPVSLIDSNEPGAAMMFYSMNNGPWQAWNGTPISVPRVLTTSLRAYSSPNDPDRFEESAINSAAYETIFFSGESAGLFSNPIGDPALTCNLPSGANSPHFTWGSPATTLGFTEPNSLTFTPRTFTDIAPDQSFELGQLTYYNGTIWSGTSATSIQLTVNLNLATPGVIETLPFTFRLLSTVNRNLNPDDDADYVYIPDVSTRFNTTIKGQTFYLVLSFGAHGPHGFTTIDTFHTHENKTMTGTIYGRFTTTPPA